MTEQNTPAAGTETTAAEPRRKPRYAYREIALAHAVALVKEGFARPGDAAVVIAGQFADFLENGSTEPTK